MVAMRFSREAQMSEPSGGFTYRRNEYGYPVLESHDWETMYQRLPAQTMLAHRVTGAIMGVLFALGAIGWVWTFVLSR
jgi:hypothetical protein